MGIGPFWIEAKTWPYQSFDNFNSKHASLDWSQIIGSAHVYFGYILESSSLSY